MKPTVIKPDARGRMTFSRYIKKLASAYYVTFEGQRIILEPMEIQETHWIDKPENAHLKAQILEGLEQAKRGEGTPWKEIKHKYKR